MGGSGPQHREPPDGLAVSTAPSGASAARFADREILLLTRIWPTRDRPSVGSFIRARSTGVVRMRVIRPRWHRLPSPLIYAILLVDALLAGPVRGVEAHMVIPTGLVGLIVARLRGVPLVVYAHGSDVRHWRRMPWPLRRLTQLVARRADRLIANSEDTASHARELGGRPEVIPPGVDLARFAPTPRPKAGRVLYLGGRNSGKGYEVALDLADTLAGPWLRDVDPADVPGLIAAHDVVLVPSRAEAFGLVAVEAIASGRWVVARAVGGLRDIVRDGVNGTLVHDDDFAGALARVPDYDPYAIAPTVQRFSLRRWQEAMARLWDDVAPSDA
jgi:glycosyltransferase involved in cell wall biosynthesis